VDSVQTEKEHRVEDKRSCWRKVWRGRGVHRWHPATSGRRTADPAEETWMWLPMEKRAF
jgi:hypothetical protein